jgi:hypothetical protein
MCALTVYSKYVIYMTQWNNQFPQQKLRRELEFRNELCNGGYAKAR